MKTTIKAKLLNLSDENREIIDNLMLRFSSAMRYSFNRRQPNAENPITKGDLEKLLQKKYKLNSRYAKDAVNKAEGIISSQEELVKMHYSDYKSKVQQCKRELKYTPSDHKKRNLKRKLDKYERKLDEYKKHLDQDTIPSVTFGGKKNFIARSKGNISNEEWKKLRNNKVCSRGCKAKKGNLNLRIIQDENGITSLRINTARKKDNGRYKKIKIPLYLPRKVNKKGTINGRNYRKMVLDKVQKEEAYYVELIRKDDGYYAHITIEEDTPKKITTDQYGIIGIDTNVDGFAITCVDEEGNYKWHKNITNHELTYTRSKRRVNLCGNLAQEVVSLIKDKGYAVVIEDLEFRRNSYQYGNKTYNRKSHQFIYRKLLTFLERGCKREGIEVKKVNPAFTSIIGKYKYQHQFGFNVHNGAAMVIARRGLGCGKEEIPKYIRDNVVKRYLERSKQDKFFNDYHYWKQWGIINSVIQNLINKRVQNQSNQLGQLKLNFSNKEKTNPKDWSWSHHRKEVLDLAN